MEPNDLAARCAWWVEFNCIAHVLWLKGLPGSGWIGAILASYLLNQYVFDWHWFDDKMISPSLITHTGHRSWVNWFGHHYLHDDVTKWTHFPRYWPFMWGMNSPVPVNSPHRGQWRGTLMFSLFYAWINDWVNNREAGETPSWSLWRQCNGDEILQ